MIIGLNITVGDDRYGNTCLELINKVKVKGATETIGPGPGMNGNGLNPGILGHAGNLQCGNMVPVPTRTDLDAHRFFRP